MKRGEKKEIKEWLTGYIKAPELRGNGGDANDADDADAGQVFISHEC